jgi:hypothetical protein
MRDVRRYHLTEDEMSKNKRYIKDRKAKEKEESKSSGLSTIAPVIISIVALIFGGYQYFDKKKLEDQVKQLDIEQKRIEIQRQEIQNKPRLAIQYIDFDISSEKSNLASFVGYDFDKHFLQWIEKDLSDGLPYSVKLSLLKTATYEGVRSHKLNIKHCRISFFMFRNAGTSNLTNISLGFTAFPGGKSYPIKVDNLEPGRGVILIIGVSKPKTETYIGTRLIPGTQLEYFDQFNNRQESFEIREPLYVSMVVGPNTIANIKVKR